MAKTILSDASVVVNSVDLSDHVESVTINSSRDLVEVTAMGDTSRQNLLGLGDATIEVVFYQDFASANVDATLWPLHTADSTFSIVVKPDSGAVSATNPSYTMTAVLPEFSPLDGAVGEASKVTVTFQNAGSSGITKATS